MGPNDETAEVIRRVRASTGLSQSKAAVAAGVSLDALQSWEQGRASPSFRAVLKLSRGWERPLVDFTPEPSNGKPDRGRPRKKVKSEVVS
jgi:transcriptional regulator with XRE-family HTH domain